MKKILAAILVLVLVAAPAAAFQEPANLGNITASVDRAAASPAIDGVLDEFSYGRVSFAAGDMHFYDNDGDKEAYVLDKGMDIGFYMSYDADKLYVFLSGDATYYYCDHFADDPGNIWNQSCIQLSLATADAIGGDRLELGLARNSDTGEIMANIWAQSPDGANELELVGGTDYQIRLAGNRLDYEIAIPWTAFLPSAPSAGDKFKINWMYGWSDDGTRFGVEYTMGCNTSKDAELYSVVTLTSNVLEEPAPEPEPEPIVNDGGGDAAPTPTPTPTPPRTGDAGTIALVAIMAIAAMGIVVLKRKAVR